MTSSREQVVTAVVGCGNWGKNHVRVFTERSDLRYCCDADPERLEAVTSSYPSLSATTSYEDVLSDDEVDAVILATPAETHAAMAVSALGAGKDVLVEKPLALTADDAQRVVDAVDESGRILGVGHLLEYHPAVEYLKSVVDDGSLGDIYYCYSQRVNLGTFRARENALWSLAPHDISVMIYLFEESPVRLEATGQDFLQDGIEDVVFLDMEFASGRIGHVQVSWLDPHKERKITVVGSEKMAVFDDMSSREKLRVYDKGAQFSDPGRHGAGFADSLTVREGDVVIPHISSAEPLDRECVAFLDAVVTRTPPRADARDGLEVVKVLQEAERCLSERRGPSRRRAGADV